MQHGNSLERATILLTAAASGILAPAAPGGIATAYSIDGHVGAEVVAFPTDGMVSPSGTLTLGNIPAGATITQAWLYSSLWFDTATPSATFNGNALGAVSAFDIDPTSPLEVYKWDVTALITGNGGYSASTTVFFASCFGMALAVAYSHPSLPLGRVLINDGSIELSDLDETPDTESTTFNALAGPGTLWVYTQADNDGGSGQTGEQVIFNGSVVGGPLDANLGNYASILQMPVTALAGTNTLDVFSPQDWFGWHLAVLHTPVPAPATGLVALAGLLVRSRPRRRA